MEPEDRSSPCRQGCGCQGKGRTPSAEAANAASAPPDQPARASGVSRRSFIRTMGASAAAASLANTTESIAREHAAQPGDDGKKAADSGPLTFGPGPREVSFTINDSSHTIEIEPSTTLLEMLRYQLNLSGTKEVCDRGACGACSVLVGGKLVASCMMLAADAAEEPIVTVENLDSQGPLDPIQEAFIRHDALQCGFCTPGLIMASKALLAKTPKPSLAEIRKGLSGNICRCGTYTNIFNAVLEASGQQPIKDTPLPTAAEKGGAGHAG